MTQNNLFKVENEIKNLLTLDKPHSDNRGCIQSIVNENNSNVSIITSKKFSIRSNHYHLTDSHFMYTIKGSYYYLFKPANSNHILTRVKVNQGSLIFTPPMESHVTIFLEDTTLLVISKNPRDQETYEKDTVRVDLVKEDQIEKYIV
jgi:oxalate decarboxylase/phosphoglucose isomerase-like protein (cupin superfamily)|tara:strand:- start:66 stop:506 length:441 start_codon:yes stop_codon:yes gene_type:complete